MPCPKLRASFLTMLGYSNGDWAYCEHEQPGVGGLSPAIVANRVSFCLGLQQLPPPVRNGVPELWGAG